MPIETPSIDAQRLMSGFRACQMIVAAGRLRLPDLVAAGPALPTVMSDLHMRVVLGGRQRTANEYRDLLAQAGLRMTRLIPTEPDYAAVEAVVAD